MLASFIGPSQPAPGKESVLGMHYMAAVFDCTESAIMAAAVDIVSVVYINVQVCQLMYWKWKEEWIRKKKKAAGVEPTTYRLWGMPSITQIRVV